MKIEKTITCERVERKKKVVKALTYKVFTTEGGGFTFLHIDEDAYELTEETHTPFPNRRFLLEKLSSDDLDKHITQIGPDGFCTCQGYRRHKYCKHFSVLEDMCNSRSTIQNQYLEDGQYLADLAEREYLYESMLATARS